MMFAFAKIKPFLKMSKSAPTDTGPYQLRRQPGNNWYEIIDWGGRIVGQVTMAQLMEAKLMHGGGCSNQNTAHPDGAFNSAEICGCQNG